MPEQHQARDLVATLRDALHKLDGTLERTREGVDEIANQAERLRAGVEALGALRPREDPAVGIEMFVDAAVDVLEVFRDLESGIPDVQAEVDTLEGIADDEESRDTCPGEEQLRGARGGERTGDHAPEPKALPFRRTMIAQCGAGLYCSYHNVLLWIHRTLKKMGLFSA